MSVLSVPEAQLLLLAQAGGFGMLDNGFNERGRDVGQERGLFSHWLLH